MYIVGFESNDAVRYAIKLGVALQMTNILRDVGEDYRNGRLYLPREELALYGIRESDIAAGNVTDAWRLFMKFQIERTVNCMKKPGWRKNAGARRSTGNWSGRCLYQGILDTIEANDYDVFNHRASLSAWEKVRRIPSLWWKMKAQ